MQPQRLLLLWANQAGKWRRSHDAHPAGALLPLCSRQHVSAAPRQAREDDSEPLQGIRTKFGRRQRRVADRPSNHARVRHTYLKVALEDPVLDRLHALARQVGRDWKEENEAATERRAISKEQANRQLTVKPRTRKSLHMTYFFVGQALGDMTGGELRRWEQRVRKCIAEQNDEARPSDYSLRFRSLAVFPPRRRNLIVAAFEPSAALRALYDRLCRVALAEKETSRENADASTKEYEFPALKDLLQQRQRGQDRRDAPRWVAHVTLGNLSGGRREDVRRLSAWLDALQCVNGYAVDAPKGVAATSEISGSRAASLADADIAVLGLALGGPAPEHVDIDWNFPFGPAEPSQSFSLDRSHSFARSPIVDLPAVPGSEMMHRPQGQLNRSRERQTHRCADAT